MNNYIINQLVFGSHEKAWKTENSLSSYGEMIKSNGKVVTKKFGKTKKNPFDFSREKNTRQDSEAWRRIKSRLER